MSSHDRTPDPPDDRRDAHPEQLHREIGAFLVNMLMRAFASPLVPKPRPLSAKELEELPRRIDALLKEKGFLFSTPTERSLEQRIRGLLQQHKTPKGVDDPIAPVDLDSLPADQADLDERVRAIVAKAGTRT